MLGQTFQIINILDIIKNTNIKEKSFTWLEKQKKIRQYFNKNEMKKNLYIKSKHLKVFFQIHFVFTLGVIYSCIIANSL